MLAEEHPLQFGRSTIAIAASFTAEPLRHSVEFWAGEMNLSTEVVFAPPNQLFQQLLDRSSLLSLNRGGVNVLLVRFEDWLTDESETACEMLERCAKDFVFALGKSMTRAAVPHLVFFCPPSAAQRQNSSLIELGESIQESVRAELMAHPDVVVVTSKELQNAYPVEACDEPYAERLAQIPYTDAFFAVLGTMIARKIWAMRNAHYKVFVLDCDGTLWSGVCGEDGPFGVKIDPDRRGIQEFIIRQHDAGMLLCLCSRNNEEDVWNVFDSRSDMLLKRHHLVACRINWKSKSENIKSLAAELNLALSSFIFVDDDPVQCAEVQANCPEVLTFALPEASASMVSFLENNWVFDHHKPTKEAVERTALYRQNSARERFRSRVQTLEEFLFGLNLQVEISELATEHAPRIAELTQRTTQFNTSIATRSASELQQLIARRSGECLTVQVKDRFGDYGLVGVMIFERCSNTLRVNTFLLSCRALARGVEHRMLARLGDLAHERGLQRIEIPVAITSRNAPVLNFLQSVAADFQALSGPNAIFQFSAELARQVKFNPTIAEKYNFQRDSEGADEIKTIVQPKEEYLVAREQAVKLKWIALEMSDPLRIHAAASRKFRDRSKVHVRTEPVPPESQIEKRVAGMIWELLDGGKTSVNDSFFDSGGDSLSAIRLLSRIRDVFGVELTVAQLFENPTIRNLSALVMRALQSEPASLSATEFDHS